MSRLDQYASLEPILLNKESTWKDALTKWTKDATAYIPLTASAKLHEIQTSFGKRGLSLGAKVLLLIGWLHAARVASAFRLKVSAMKFDETGQWQILWTDAKTTAKIGPYTTPSAINPEYKELVTQWLARLSPSTATTLLFPKHLRAEIVKEVRAELRSHDEKCTLRALRHGALVALAEAGIDLETVLLFSGHTTVKMLLRYLNRGMSAGKRNAEAAQAARQVLLPRQQ